MIPSTPGVTPLRQRMLDDMRMRKLEPKTQAGYLRAVRQLAVFLKASPDTATVEDLRRFQLHLVDRGTSPITLNATITGLKFFFDVTLGRIELMAKMQPVRVAHKLPVVLSRPEVALRAPSLSPGQVYRALIPSSSRGEARRARLRHNFEMPLPTPTLHTSRLRLRTFSAADTDVLFAMHSSPRVLRYWDAPPWRERGLADRFIEACRQIEAEGTGARLAIERASDHGFVGWCSLVKWNPDYRSARLGYCLDDAAWGQGFATEAAGALLQWAFHTLDLNRVQAETDTRNTASARVLEKLGFVREGTLREDCIVDGEVSDSWVYGLLRREWRPPKVDARMTTT